MELRCQLLTVEMPGSDTGDLIGTPTSVRLDPLIGHSSRILPERGPRRAGVRARSYAESLALAGAHATKLPNRRQVAPAWGDLVDESEVPARSPPLRGTRRPRTAVAREARPPSAPAEIAEDVFGARPE